MTQDEIIEMARQAGFRYTGNFSVDKGESLSCFQADLEAFAKLVAKKAYLDGLENGIKAEREACAKLCEEYETNNDIADTWLNIVSEVIRARGQA